MLGDRVMIDACVGGGDDGCLWRRWGACAGGGGRGDDGCLCRRGGG